tara:strand:+ start:507 stop:1181 length:675 start_codon:yes stop_codon:yes gene_type:complete
MDVTAEILNQQILYGASDNTAPGSLSSSRSLNYATGPSIMKPDKVQLSLLPFTLKYQDSIGLFGAENYFVKVTIRADDTFIARCFEEPFWECATVKKEDSVVNTYSSAVIDVDSDLNTVNTYDPATMLVGLPPVAEPYVSVDLNNLKTGNQYIDSWLDVRLYTKQREEHPYDKMYIRKNDEFYIGFHARNTKRLPYNIECLIGDQYLPIEDISSDDRRYIARIV